MDEKMKRSHIRTNMAMMDSLVVLCLMYSMFCTGLVDGLTMTLNKNAVRNSDVQILITTSSITSVVILTNPGGSSDNCAAPILGPGSCTSLDLSQDLTTGVTTYSISSLVRSRDEGTWTASHAVSDTNTIDIKVLTIPTLTVSQTVSALTLSSSNTQSLTITATCAYPAVSLDLYFVPTGGGTAVSSPSSTAICTSTGNTGCADTDAKSYDCVIVPKLETSLSAGTYYVQFVVNLAGQYEPIGLNSTITDTVITIEASSSSICDSCTTTYVLAALGIVFAVVCIVFCWMVYLQCSGKFQGPCSVFTKSKCSVKQTLIAAIIATSLCVIGIILCIVGLVTLIVALAVVGFVLPVFTHVIVIILLTFFCCGKIMEKDGDNKAVRARPDGQDAKPRTERTPRSAGSPTSASNIKTKWRNNQVSDSNESDGSNDTPRRKLEDVPQGRKLPALELVDASQKANTLEPLEVNETKKLKKKKKRRSKEEKAQVNGEY